MSLERIIKMVESSSGPDRNLDYIIHSWALNGEGQGAYGDHPAYSASVDCALALAERVLPGWQVSISSVDGVGQCMIHRRGVPHNEQPFGESGVYSRPLPLALLLATLRALRTNGEADEAV